VLQIALEEKLPILAEELPEALAGGVIPPAVSGPQPIAHQ